MEQLFFNFDELFHSDTAKAKGFNNTTSDPKILTKLMELVWYGLTPIRKAVYAKYKVGLNIENAYRCEKLRAYLKAAKTGHPEGECADLTCTKLTNRQLFDFIHSLKKQGLIEYDQLIYEVDTNCCHFGYVRGANRNQTLIRTVVKGQFVYTPV